MPGFSDCVDHRYRVELVPGSTVSGPAVNLSEPGGVMEGTVKHLSAEELYLKDAKCDYTYKGERVST
ncbi:hypothetical protein KIPB_014477 [Kipferlia bialata]|uniref:Uncharacterized protein n=1 Tax=Kipferlia bialata TaxID=797122 RepID=A0A9K3DAD0_9EUKA|nr:hypothetical protein KIPB_014477 [Kipferlia bialata]|eukprot:g14477.t1